MRCLTIDDIPTVVGKRVSLKRDDGDVIGIVSELTILENEGISPMLVSVHLDYERGWISAAAYLFQLFIDDDEQDLGIFKKYQREKYID